MESTGPILRMQNPRNLTYITLGFAVSGISRDGEFGSDDSDMLGGLDAQLYSPSARLDDDDLDVIADKDALVLAARDDEHRGIYTRLLGGPHGDFDLDTAKLLPQGDVRLR